MLRPMPRLARFVAMLSLIVLLPAVAAAQMGQGPPTPLAVDLAKVPVGSWAQYNMTMGTMPPMTMKMALVGRAAAGNTLEMAVEGGLAAKAGGKIITQMTLPAGSDGKVQKLVLQMGQSDPMEMPVEAAQGKQFTKPDPKTLVKTETIKVAAGSFKTKHYRDKTPQGDTVDYWVTESVPPIGMVKFETSQSNPMVGGPIKMELSAVGKDAKSSISKAPKPFDRDAFMKQMTAGAGPGAGAPAAH